MEISCTKPLSKEAADQLTKLFGDPVASDEKTFLYDGKLRVNRRDMNRIADKAKQPVTVSLRDEGSIVTLSDGRRYVVTAKGWKRLVAAHLENAPEPAKE